VALTNGVMNSFGARLILSLGLTHEERCDATSVHLGVKETMAETIVDQLNKLTEDQDYCEPHAVSSLELIDAICRLTDQISLADESLAGMFYTFTDRILELRCELHGSHQWEHDHCGYWGHQYCRVCRCRKYPSIPSRCGEAQRQLGKVTEEEYVAAIKAQQ
jgi:hypothetical protein